MGNDAYESTKNPDFVTVIRFSLKLDATSCTRIVLSLSSISTSHCLRLWWAQASSTSSSIKCLTCSFRLCFLFRVFRLCFFAAWVLCVFFYVREPMPFWHCRWEEKKSVKELSFWKRTTTRERTLFRLVLEIQLFLDNALRLLQKSMESIVSSKLPSSSNPLVTYSSYCCSSCCSSSNVIFYV